MVRARSIATLVMPVVLGLAAPASAHQQTATFGEITRGTVAIGGVEDSGPGTIVWRLRVRAIDLVAALKAQAASAAPAEATVQNRRRAAYLLAGQLFGAFDARDVLRLLSRRALRRRDGSAISPTADP